MAQKLVILIPILFISFVIGCSTNNYYQKEITPTLTPSIVPKTISPTVNKIPTVTQSPTIPPHINPTLSLLELRSIVLDRIQNNSDCLLPCLWGFIPGKNDKQDLFTFLDQFYNATSDSVYISRFDYNDNGILNFIIKKDNLAYYYTLAYRLENNSISQLEFNTLVKTGDFEKELYGEIYYDQTNHNYILPTILKNYGQPSQVLIFTYASEVDTQMKWFPFALVLYYEERGFLIQYIMRTIITNDIYSGCPDQSFMHVYSWDPEKLTSLDEVITKYPTIIDEGSIQQYKTIQEATDLNLESFFQKFKNPNNESCIETPKGLW